MVAGRSPTETIVRTDLVKWKNTNPYREGVCLAIRNKHCPGVLYDLLRHMTPYGTEQKIIDMLPCKDQGQKDEFGNFWLRIDHPDGKKSDTMFSCHMDTVHIHEGYIDLLVVDENKPSKQHGILWAGMPEIQEDGTTKYRSEVLGADDKVGVWLMCSMIHNKIPGLYVFHVGEEVGCKGAGWIVKNNPKFVEGITKCIAFDRKDTTHLITHQRGTRMASDVAAENLCKQLNDSLKLPGNIYKPNTGGVYTDSAEYANIIPEIFNMSVGYYNQHGPTECVDVLFLYYNLLPALLKVDWDDIPVKRDPKVKTYSSGASTGYWEGGVFRRWGEPYFTKTDWDVPWEDAKPDTPYYKLAKWNPKAGIVDTLTKEQNQAIMRGWCRANPEEAGNMIYDLLFDTNDLENELAYIYGPAEDEEEDKPLDDSVADIGMPAEDDPKYKEEIAAKYAFIDKLLHFSTSVALPFQKKYKNILSNQSRRVANVRVREKKEGNVSYQDYANLNAILMTTCGVYLEQPKKVEFPEELLTLLQECNKYIIAHGWERGLDLENHT